jgi:hypothetical protein
MGRSGISKSSMRSAWSPFVLAIERHISVGYGRLAWVECTRVHVNRRPVAAVVLALLVAGDPGTNHPVTATTATAITTTTTTTPTRSPATNGSQQLPAPLDRALRHLQDQVRR